MLGRLTPFGYAYCESKYWNWSGVVMVVLSLQPRHLHPSTGCERPSACPLRIRPFRVKFVGVRDNARVVVKGRVVIDYKKWFLGKEAIKGSMQEGKENEIM